MSAAEEEGVGGPASAGASNAQNPEIVSDDPYDFVIPPSVTDFARKLYNLLEDPLSDFSVVCWAPTRDQFFIKDTSVFSKTILPRFFNHSNFSSFVRQLNKFGFHKVKSTPPDSQTWVFHHPHFHKDKREDLHHIERKGGSSLQVSFDTSKTKTKDASPSSGGIHEEPVDSEESMADMTSELERLRTKNNELRTRLMNLERTNHVMGLNIQSLEKKAISQDEKIASVLQILAEQDDLPDSISIPRSIFQPLDPLQYGQSSHSQRQPQLAPIHAPVIIEESSVQNDRRWSQQVPGMGDWSDLPVHKRRRIAEPFGSPFSGDEQDSGSDYEHPAGAGHHRVTE